MLLRFRLFLVRGVLCLERFQLLLELAGFVAGFFRFSAEPLDPGLRLALEVAERRGRDEELVVRGDALVLELFVGVLQYGDLPGVAVFLGDEREDLL